MTYLATKTVVYTKEIEASSDKEAFEIACKLKFTDDDIVDEKIEMEL